MSVESIIASNDKLGIKTAFFYEDNGILGYTENGVVYLNEFYNNDLGLVNKHEVLHLFEDSKQFKGTKKIIFDILGKEELNKLRNEYYLKYNLLYSKEEIKNGILDNEIAIDIIINNGKFPINIDDYVNNAYETIISQKETISLTNKARKYLSLNISANTKSRYERLDKWDLLFANEYYKGKVKPTGKDRFDKIKFDSMMETLTLKGLWLKDFEIDVKDNPELERMIKSQIASYNSKGEYDKAEQLKNSYEESMAKLANKITWDLLKQYFEIGRILDSNPKYSDSFKYLILNETFTKTYRYENGNRIVEKRIPHKTILPNMFLNEYIIEDIYSNIDKYNSFTDLYFDSLEKYNNEFLNSDNVVFNRTSNGYWIKFKGGKEGTPELEKRAQDLGNLIRDTPWCTRKNPAYWIGEGREFYVFVDNGKRPHVAVAISGGKIDEVRGVKGEADQEIEDEYRELTIDFLKNNKNIINADKWLEKEERNYRMSRYASKIRNGLLTDEDLKNLVKDLNKREILTHGDINSNEREVIKLIAENKSLRDKLYSVDDSAKKVIEIVDKIECNNRILEYYEKIENDTLIKEDLSQLAKDIKYYFHEYKYIDNQQNLINLINSKDNLFRTETAKRLNCKPDEVYVGDVKGNDYFYKKETKVFPYKYVIGDVNFIHVNDSDASNLVHVFGNLELTFGRNIDLSSLEQVDGDVDALDTENVNLESLQYIGGKLDAYRSDSKFHKLRVVKGEARFEWYFEKEINNLEEVGGNLIIGNYIEEMKSLKCVGGKVIFDDYNKLKELPNLESCEELINAPKEIKDEFKETYYSDGRITREKVKR